MIFLKEVGMFLLVFLRETCKATNIPRLLVAVYFTLFSGICKNDFTFRAKHEIWYEN